MRNGLLHCHKSQNSTRGMRLLFKHTTIRDTKSSLKSLNLFYDNQIHASKLRPFLLRLVTFSSLSVLGFESNRNTICEKSPVPPQFGRMIPHHLLLGQKRQFNSTSKIGSNTSGGIPIKEDRNECLVCKKYSQGPCGKLFTKWLNCIDENNGKESICDELLLPLDKCLQKHEEYYKKINIYENIGENVNVNYWKEFIVSLESGQEQDIVFEDFPPEIVPQVQIRLEKMVGVVQYHPKLLRDGKDCNLILGYVKDNKGNILAGASFDELVDYEGMLVLRFHTSADTQDVITFGIYMESHEKNTKNIVIYKRAERLPS